MQRKDKKSRSSGEHKHKYNHKPGKKDNDSLDVAQPRSQGFSHRILEGHGNEVGLK